MEILAHLDDGSTVDVTTGVQALYDIVIQSLDWGSRFLTVEDALPVLHVAKTCGFTQWEEAQRYVNSDIQQAEEAEWRRRHGVPITGAEWHSWITARRETHEHEFSSVGECLFPVCRERTY